MTGAMTGATTGTVAARADAAPPSFVDVLRAEWVKLRSVRSARWTLWATFLLGAGLTVLMCYGNADWLAKPGAEESPGSFITWGMAVAPITAVVLGALVVTSEYGTGMIRTTFAAVPSRGRVLAARALLVAGVLGVVGTITALAGYAGGNYFLDREGVGMALEGEVLRAMYGSGLYLAGIGLFAVAVGFLVRHTAGTICLLLALMVMLGFMVNLVPGALGEWLTRLMPGNAGSAIASPVPFNPDLLDAWTGLAVFAVEALVLLAAAYVVVRRRDA